jgi:hypothetical protein
MLRGLRHKGKVSEKSGGFNSLFLLVDKDPEISLIRGDTEEKGYPNCFLSSHTEPEVVEKTEGITSYGYIVKNSGETVR